MKKQHQMSYVRINEISFIGNPRTVFDDAKLKELTDSIKVHGVLEPVILRPRANKSGYDLIAGERRIRAAQSVGLVEVPAVLREMSDAEIIEIQIIENVQRAEMNTVDEADAYKRLRDELKYSPSDIRLRVGKSLLFVSQMLALADSHEVLKKQVRDKKLGRTVALQIAQLSDEQIKAQCIAALSKPDWSKKLTTHKAAASFISRLLAESKAARSNGKAKTKGASSNGHYPNYVKDWLKYLVSFNTASFIKWRTIVNGRTDVQTLSEAVDVVMRENGSRAASVAAVSDVR